MSDHGLQRSKKFSKKVKTKSGRTKTVRYGAKGYSISPGTKKGDSYCARSNGQMKKNLRPHVTPTVRCVCLGKKWKCSGSKSRRSKS